VIITLRLSWESRHLLVRRFRGGNDQPNVVARRHGAGADRGVSFIIASLGLTLNVTANFFIRSPLRFVLTTLLTPISSRARTRGQLVRSHRSEAAGESLEIYTRWVGQLGGSGTSFATKLMRRWFSQMALNVAFDHGSLRRGSYVERNPPG